MKTEQFNIKKPNTQYSFKTITYKGYTSNTIIINSKTVFYVKPPIDGGYDDNDGKSWNTAYATLGKALETAKSLVPSENNQIEIWMQTGEYTISSELKTLTNYISIYGGFTGSEDLKTERSSNNLYPNQGTIITTNNARRVFNLDYASKTAIKQNTCIIDNITFKKCRDGTKGSAFYLKYASVNIQNCNFIDNTAGSYGGSICSDYSSPTIENCTFKFVDYADDKLSTTTNNRGSIYINYISEDAKAKTIINNCVFENLVNSTTSGAAICLGTSEKNDIIISNSHFRNNTVNISNKSGGAIYIDSNSKVDILNSYIYDNNCNDKTYYGAGIRIVNNANITVNLDNVIFKDNKNNSTDATNQTKTYPIQNLCIIDKTAASNWNILLNMTKCTIDTNWTKAYCSGSFSTTSNSSYKDMTFSDDPIIN